MSGEALTSLWYVDACSIATREHPDGESVTAWFTPDVEGLAITQVETSPKGTGYSITHVASGTNLMFRMAFVERASAQRCLLALAPLADWTQEGKVLAADRDLRDRVTVAIQAVIDQGDAS